MKQHRVLDEKREKAAEAALYRAVLTLRSTDECAAFFRDLCTPAELQALKDRWTVAEHLWAGRTYRQIHDRTGVSITTIGRVARYLNDAGSDGTGGYRLALKRLGTKQPGKPAP
jgi:TrpR-related protein YerC/YecD